MSPEITKEFAQRFRSLATEFSEQDLQEFLQSATVVEVPAGRKLIKARMPVDSIYLTLSGALEILVEINGVTRKVDDVGPGEWLGEVSVLSGDPRASASVSTATPTRVLRLKHQALEEMMSKDGELSILILQHLVLMMADKLVNLKTQLSVMVKAKRAADGSPAVNPEPTDDKADYWPVCNLADSSGNLTSFLSTLPGIENFSPTDINILTKSVKVTLYPARHMFTYQGERGDSVYLVVDGAVLMRSVNPLANTVSEKILNIGEWFALPSLTSDLTEFETVSAPKPVFVASITRDDFNRMFDESRAVSRFFLYMLVNELARKVQVLHATMRGSK